MLDWASAGKMKATRDSELLLQVCSHLANGAKHFELVDRRHKSVSSTDEGGSWDPPGSNPPGCDPPGWNPSGRLAVNLKDEAATQLGPSIGVVELAEKVMVHWTAKDLA